MKLTIVIVLAILALINPALVICADKDPCPQNSNAEMRECYAREQTKVNAESDALASKIATDLRKEADGITDLPEAAALMRKAAAAVSQSQVSWKIYRDQHCKAVRYSWTTGSGAGTAYESCMCELGRERLRDLKDLSSN